MLAAGTYPRLTVSRNLTILGAGPAKTVIDGNQSDIVLTVVAGNVRLEGLTIQNGGIYPWSAYIPSMGSGVVNAGPGNLTILHCVFTNNNGGAVYSRDGIVSIFDSTFNGNMANAEDQSVITSHRTLNLVRSAVVNNTAYRGAVSLTADYGGKGYITQSTIANNFGSGIYMFADSLYVSSSTIAGNIVGIEAEYGQNLTVKGSIIANNPSSNCILPGPDYKTGGVSAQSGGGNFIWPWFKSHDPCYALMTGFIPPADPKLGPLANNGGPTVTMLPQPGSIAIGTGACTDAFNIGLGVDQRSLVRPASGCDAGAVDTHATTDSNPDALWWKLDEGSGYTANDSSPHGLAGSVNSLAGRPEWSGGEVVAPTLLYNLNGIYAGASSTRVYAYESATARTDNVTLSAWVNCGGCGTSRDMFVFYNGRFPNDGYGLEVRHSDRHVLLSVGSAIYDFGWSMPTTSTWTHLALVRSAGVWRLYVNGNAAGSAYRVSPVVPGPATSLGVDTFGGNGFAGFIDDFRVYSRALATGELQALAKGQI